MSRVLRATTQEKVPLILEVALLSISPLDTGRSLSFKTSSVSDVTDTSLINEIPRIGFFAAHLSQKKKKTDSKVPRGPGPSGLLLLLRVCRLCAYGLWPGVPHPTRNSRHACNQDSPNWI